MPETSSTRRRWLSAAVWRTLAGRLLRLVGTLIQRGYALGLFVLIVWLSWKSVHYLVTSLVAPAAPPAQIADLPRRLDESLLHGVRPDWLGLKAVENPRGPLAHYHRFEGWLQSDPVNDCTRSGCHGPLPHAGRKEVRAFLNMHATSIHCGVCHFQHEDGPLSLTWYDVADGRAGDAPAVLRAYAWLEEHREAVALTRAEQREISEWLRLAAAAAGGAPELERVGRAVAAVRPDSERLPALLAEALAAVQRSLRGAYGAKLAVRDSATGQPLLGHPRTAAAIADWLRRGAQTQGAEREALLAAVHPLRGKEALECSACHRPEGARLNLTDLGYPAGRIRALHEPAVFEMIEHISAGRPFYMPTFQSPR
jgi:hypothetical protein